MSLDININLSRKAKDYLDEINIIGIPIEDSDLVNNTIEIFYNIIKGCKSKLRNYFNENELFFLFDVFNANKYNGNISAKKYLLYECEDVIKIDSLDLKYEINVEDLINKIKELDEFEAFTIITVINTFWRNPKKYSEDLSKLFE